MEGDSTTSERHGRWFDRACRSRGVSLSCVFASQVRREVIWLKHQCATRNSKTLPRRGEAGWRGRVSDLSPSNYGAGDIVYRCRYLQRWSVCEPVNGLLTDERFRDFGLPCYFRLDT